MSNLKPGQPSSFAEEAVKKSSAARWPRPPLSSDHDDGGVSLGLTNLKPKAPAAAPREEHEYTKLNATSKPFVPAGIVSDAPSSSSPMHASPPVGDDPLKPHPNPDEGKNGKSETSDGIAFASQDRISDKLMNLYHKQRRNTATTSQGYLSGAFPAPTPEPRGIDSIVQLGTNQRGPAQRLPGLPSTQSYGALPPVADNFHIPDPIPISSYARGNGHPAYRSGLPNSASDGNITGPHITGPRNIRGGYNETGAVIPYNAPEALPPKALPPLQLQPETQEVKSQRSPMLNALVGETGPSLQDLLNPFFLPFTVIYESAGPAEWGVIRIKNIPFGTTRAEIVALVGRNAKILNDSLEPVHIIMERVSSKTMDAFVEFNTFQDAVEVVEKFQNNAGTGRPARISNRMVEIELSSQAQLMKALFPIASGVTWVGARPEIRTESQFPWENFKSFFTEEEMTMLCKHVECPQRAQSSFSQDCPERPYECMISTLKKIPWYMAQNITVKERHAVYATCCKMITILSSTVDRFPRHERLTPQLLNRLVHAAMLCTGFTVQQKDNIAVLARMEEQKTREFNQPRFADLWCHLYTLGPKPNIPLDVLEFYIAVIREETNRTVDSLNIGQKIALQNRSAGTSGYFGYLWAEVDFPSGPAFDRMTLAEVNHRELQAIDRILRRAVEGGVPPPSYTKGMHGL